VAAIMVSIHAPREGRDMQVVIQW